jgi:hypothetical protein
MAEYNNEAAHEEMCFQIFAGIFEKVKYTGAGQRSDEWWISS